MKKMGLCLYIFPVPLLQTVLRFWVQAQKQVRQNVKNQSAKIYKQKIVTIPVESIKTFRVSKISRDRQFEPELGNLSKPTT